jgi:hypothetical protein
MNKNSRNDPDILEPQYISEDMDIVILSEMEETEGNAPNKSLDMSYMDI